LAQHTAHRAVIAPVSRNTGQVCQARRRLGSHIVSIGKKTLAPLAPGAAMLLTTFGGLQPTSAGTMAPAEGDGCPGTAVAYSAAPMPDHLSIILVESKAPAAITAVAPGPAGHGLSAG
jgi:hypothetical protein